MKTKLIIPSLLALLVLQSCASLYIKNGNQAYENLQYHDAIRLLEKGLKKKEDYNARKNLADAYYKLSNFSQAVKHYEAAMLDPKFTDDDRMNYGRSLISTGDTQKAGEIFSGMISRNNSNESLYSLRQAAFTQDKIKRDSARFAIRKESVPGVINVSAPVPYKDGFLVTAQSKKGQKDPYNGLSYNNLLFSSNSGDTWSSPKEIENLNGPFHDAYCSISKDGRWMVFTRSNSEGKKLKNDEKQTSNTMLFIREMSQDGKWSEALPMPFCRDNFMYAHPAFSPEGLSLVFASNMTGTMGGMDLFVTEKTENGWSNPVNLGSSINTSGQDVFPFFKTEDTLYFSTNGRITLGGLDIHQVSKKNGSWGKAKHFGYPFNSFADDFGVYFKTANTGFLSSNRGGPDELYSFVISPSLYKMEGLVVDKSSMKPIENAKIIIKNLTDGTEELDYTDSEGIFTYEFELDKKYKIIAEKEDYFNLSKDFNITEKTKPEELKAIFEMDKLIVSKPSDSTSNNNPSDQNGKSDSAVDGKSETTADGKEESTSDDKGKDGKSGSSSNGKDGKTGKDGKSGKDHSKDKTNSGTEYSYAIPRILWDYNDANIRQDAIPYLEDLVKLFSDNPGLKVEIRSHCDSRGSHLYNDALSQQRADAIVEYLKQRGVNTSKFTSKGMGKRKLVNRCSDNVECSENEHQDNRRSEFLILSK